jgi:hypothetical protein
MFALGRLIRLSSSDWKIKKKYSGTKGSISESYHKYQASVTSWDQKQDFCSQETSEWAQNRQGKFPNPEN